MVLINFALSASFCAVGEMKGRKKTFLWRPFLLLFYIKYVSDEMKD